MATADRITQAQNPSGQNMGQEVVRLICVVHGVGSQPKGEFLAQVVEPLVRWVRAWRGAKDVRFWARLRPESGPARARIEITFPRRRERWEIVEANWAAAFYPEAEFDVLAWGYHMLLELPKIVSKMVREIYADDPPPRMDPAYRPMSKDPAARVYDWIVGTALGVAWFSLYFLVLLVSLLFFALALLPSWLVFPTWARRAVQGLVETLVAGIGDMLAIVKNPVSLASIVEALESAVAPYFSSDAQSPRPSNLVVLAHSGGATPSAYAMADEQFWQRVAQSPGPPVPTTLLTAGSSLNMAWIIGSWLTGKAKQAFWGKELPEGLRWVDVYTRYDPVPHGLPNADLVKAIAGKAEVNVVRVVNHDSFFSDHGAYWGNYEEFVTRLVYEIMEQDAAALRLIDYDAIESHRRKIGTISMLRLLVIGTILAIPAVFWTEGARLTGQLLRQLSEAPLPGLVQTLLGWCAQSPPLLFVLNVGLLALALYALWQLVRALLAAVLYKPYEPPSPSS